MFAILSFMSPLLYQWEQGSPVPEMERFIGPEKVVEDQLRLTLDTPEKKRGLRFRELLTKSSDPADVLRRFEMHGFNKLPLPIHTTYPPQSLEMIMEARVASWIKMIGLLPGKLAWAQSKSEYETAVKENAYMQFKIH